MPNKEFIVGLDIGNSSIKLAKFIKERDGLRLIKANLEEIKYSGDEAHRQKDIVDTLKRLLQVVDIKKSCFIVGINSPHTAMRMVTTPFMPKPELQNAIKIDAKNYFTFPANDASLDFEILKDTFEKGTKKYQLLVATAPSNIIEGYLSLLSKVGIKPTSIVPVAYALEKLVESLYYKEDKVNCFIDIGESNTELIIFSSKGKGLLDAEKPSPEGGMPNLIFSRKIPVTGTDFTKSMMGVLISERGRLELSRDEAERIKRLVGVPSESESKIIDDKISTIQILSMIRPPLEHLANEIDRSFAYYREETSGRDIDSLVLFGAGACLEGLANFLSEKLGIEVIQGNPLVGLRVDSAVKSYVENKGFSSQFAVAIGLALTEGEGINLLPQEIKEEAKLTIRRAAVKGFTTAVVLILALIYVGMRIELSNFQKRINAVEVQLSSLKFQPRQIIAQSLANKILADEPYWEDIFKELTNLMHHNVYLTGLRMENRNIIIQGVIDSQEKETVLSEFIQTLEKGIFKNVKLVTTREIEGKSANEFELKCWLD